MENRLRTLILGAAAGGGLPQWNCGCANCKLARSNDTQIIPQTQSSLAASANGKDWAILNTSPDIRQQIADNEVLHPDGLRHTPICSVLLTNGDIDHIAGLLILREKQAFRVFLTAGIAEIIAKNPVFDVLDREHVEFVQVELNQPFELAPGLEAELFSVPGKVPLYLESETVDTRLEGDQTVGVRLSAHHKTAFYIPGCAQMTDTLAKSLFGAELVYFDGTVYENEEMITTGTGVKTGGRMGHMSMEGPTGSLATFSYLEVKRKVYIHINNTNPVWNPVSAQRKKIERSGWEIGQDGMEIVI